MHDKTALRKRILLDLTTSFNWRGKPAVGIVRTEREIAYRLLHDSTIEVVPTIFVNGTIYAISTEEALRLITVVLPRSANSGQANPTNKVAESLTFRTKSLLRRSAPRIARQILRLIPTAGRDSARESLRFAYLSAVQVLKARGQRTNRIQQPALLDAQPTDLTVDLKYLVHPDENDIFVMLGLGWDVIDCRLLGLTKLRSGMKIAAVIYDLIPTKFPKFLGGDPKDYFRNYLIQITDLADHSYCISKTTEKDYHEFCLESGLKPPSTSVIYLGANLPAASKDDEFSPETLNALKQRKYALAVGTFEIRKNYGFLISLWEDLSKEPDFQLDLVFAGMPGWGVDDIISKLLSSPLYGKRIHWLKGLSDAGISWLYEHSHVVVFPSFYEGWGLPVIEAYQHRRHVISSDRGSVPEAGLGISTILDIDNPEAWKIELRRQSKLREPQNIPDVKLPTWEQATTEVKDKLAAL